MWVDCLSSILLPSEPNRVISPVTLDRPQQKGTLCFTPASDFSLAAYTDRAIDPPVLTIDDKKTAAPTNRTDGRGPVASFGTGDAQKAAYA